MLINPVFFRIKRAGDTFPWTIEVYDTTGRAIGIALEPGGTGTFKSFETAEEADVYARETLKLQRLYAQ